MKKEIESQTENNDFPTIALDGVGSGLGPLDFYWENGRVVLTAHYLERRSHCCGNGCRHCPYEKLTAPNE